jgi:hypothetical protein
MERCCSGCRKPLTPDDTSFIKDGLPYCCAACATGASCTCDPRAQASAYSRRSTSRLDRAIPLEAHLNEWQS